MESVNCCAVVLAAGASRRMGACKQEIPLLGVPALVYPLRAFAAAQCVQRVVLVCPPGQEAHYQALLAHWACAEKLAAVVPGGATRQQSALAGALAAGPCEYLAVHDGARPLVQPEEIDLVVADAARYGAAALAVPVKDTIKLAGEDGLVRNTPCRSRLWAVQTPQVFRAATYRTLLQSCQEEYTDDCQLFEQAGLPVHLCRGSYSNSKLTTPEDIPAAESLLREREAK